MTLNIRSWVAEAAPGETQIYHLGFLARARARDYDAHRIGQAAYKAYEAGHVILYQRRLGHLRYQYIMQRV